MVCDNRICALGRYAMSVKKFFSMMSACLVLAVAVAAPALARDSIRLGTANCGVFPALPIIAEQNGYFEAVGLDVELHEYGVLTDGLTDMVSGKIDITMSTDITSVIHIVNGGPYTVFANLAYSGRSQGVLARKDKGVEAPSDLKGKRIGVIKGTGAHFYLDMFLMHHGISDDVEVVFLPYKEVIPKFVSGEIDAYCLWTDMIVRGRQQFEGETVLFKEENIVIKTVHLGASKKYIDENPQIIEKLLRAMLMADEYMKKNYVGAAELVAAARNKPVDFISKEWEEWDFDVSLYQSLLLGFESVAEWAVRQGMTESKDVPAFMERFHVAQLKTLEPESVTIID